MSDLLEGFWGARVERGLLIARRTPKRSDDMDAFLASFDGFYAALDGHPSSEFRLLIDLRASVGRNDPEFEQRLVERRRELFRAFERTALLVRTAIGQIQVQRHIDEDGFSRLVHVFLAEPEALSWLRKN